MADTSSSHLRKSYVRAPEEPSDGLFDEFYRQTYVPLMKYALSRIRHREDAEELVSEALAVAWARYCEGFSPDRAWVFGVLKNKMGDHVRRAHTRRSVPVDSIPETPTPNDSSAASALRIDVERALVRLSDTHREVLVLAFWSDLSTAEAARVLGISHGAYRVRLTRAKRELCHHTRDLHEERK